MSPRLSTAFTRARIPASIGRAPLRDVNRDIFQLDVTREPRERIDLWPGAGDNEIEPLSVSESLRQLVLRVCEPRRAFVDRVRVRGGLVTRGQIEEFVREAGGGRVLHPRGSSWLIERYTDPADRRFLIGFDQGHLFAAQLPHGDTVREAHEALKPAEVRAAEARSPGTAVRQGEWFFVPLLPREDGDVRQHLSVDIWGRPRRGRLPGEGEPHWAEELIGLPGGRDPATGLQETRLYVRGSIHHRDHKTVWFDRWRRVHLNRAVRRRRLMARGFYWID